MWPRVLEILLGCWMISSPFTFGHRGDDTFLWVNDILSGVLVVALAGVSFRRRTSHAHLATCGVALWLIGFGYIGSGYPTPPALQNDILVGLLLLMFAIIPSQAFLPPKPWRDVLEKESSSAVEAEQRDGLQKRSVRPGDIRA